jgi:hypothetical protein
MSDDTPAMPENVRSHLVILGAGASRACCPSGDANGRQLPVIADFIETLQLREKLEAAGVSTETENFEALYSRLVADGNHAALVAELEDEVFNYFAELRLPSEPTIYDHLVLSLRPKDLVATFNWDPFLIQAVRRCRPLAPPPSCLHLHGNVAIGYCVRHPTPSFGLRGAICQQCGEALVGSRLLYPVAQKNYTDDPFISHVWKSLQSTLGSCFLFTIFGYGAPDTDLEAVDLMKLAWGDVYTREMEETEIIDIRPEDDLRDRWDPFIHSHHYQIHTDFYESMQATLPRRSVEMMIRQLMDAEWIDPFPMPRNADWDGLRAWVRPFVEQEQAIGNTSTSS